MLSCGAGTSPASEQIRSEEGTFAPNGPTRNSVICQLRPLGAIRLI
jgi:hypothetical protein